MVEAYSLWQGLKQLENLGVDKVMVFGGSRIIIQAMNVHSQIKNLKLDRLIERIKTLTCSFWTIKFYHVLRALNQKVPIESTKTIFMLIMLSKMPISLKCVVQGMNCMNVKVTVLNLHESMGGRSLCAGSIGPGNYGVLYGINGSNHLMVSLPTAWVGPVS